MQASGAYQRSDRNQQRSRRNGERSLFSQYPEEQKCVPVAFDQLDQLFNTQVAHLIKLCHGPRCRVRSRESQSGREGVLILGRMVVTAKRTTPVTGRDCKGVVGVQYA